MCTASSTNELLVSRYIVELHGDWSTVLQSFGAEDDGSQCKHIHQPNTCCVWTDGKLQVCWVKDACISILYCVFRVRRCQLLRFIPWTLTN